MEQGGAGSSAPLNSGHVAARLQDTDAGFDTRIMGFSPDFKPHWYHYKGPGKYSIDKPEDFNIEASTSLSEEEYDNAMQYAYQSAQSGMNWDPSEPRQCAVQAGNIATAAGHPIYAQEQKVAPGLPRQMTPNSIYNYFQTPQPIDLTNPNATWTVRPIQRTP